MMLLLVHAGVTVAMFGVILVVQVVHYPLFRYVGAETFRAYQAAHMRRISWVVVPLMTVEFATAVLLLWVRPAGLSIASVLLGIGLVLFIWVVTAVMQVPAHRRLTDGFSPAAHRWLVRSNWARTAAWAVRSVLVLWMVSTAFGA